MFDVSQIFYHIVWLRFKTDHFLKNLQFENICLAVNLWKEAIIEQKRKKKTDEKSLANWTLKRKQANWHVRR